MKSGAFTAVASVLLVAAGLALLVLVAFDSPEETPPTQEKPETPPKVPAPTVDISAGGQTTRVLMDKPEWDTSPATEAAPAAKRVFHVSPRGNDGADGSASAPWKTLQAALCRLEPGDHLVIGVGIYPSPIDIGPDCRDGTPELPIQVTAAKDAVLSGVKSDQPAPVLRIDRSFWRLAGLEINVDWASGFGVRIEPPARGLVIEGFHVRNGVGGGIELAENVSDITLRHNHLHHLGVRKGGPGTRLKAPAAGIRVAPGLTGIRLIENNIHSVFGPSLDVGGAGDQVMLEGNAVQQNPPDD